MSISSVQKFLGLLTSEKRFSGQAWGSISSAIFLRYPKDIFTNSKHRNKADLVLIDLIYSLGYKINALDIPIPQREKFIAVTSKEQRANLLKIIKEGGSIYPQVLERLGDYLTTSDQVPDLELFLSLGYKLPQSKIKTKINNPSEISSEYSEFASW